MQQFDITVPANRPFLVNSPGRFIKYVSGSNGGGDVSLLVTPGFAGGQVLTLVPGQWYRVASDMPVPSSWTVANKAGGATIIGTLVIGNGDFGDATVAGNVNVIDVSRQQTLSNQAFMGYAQQSGTANVYSQVAIFNPAGSGKNCYVQRMAFGSSSASDAGTMTFITGTAGMADKGAVLSKLSGGANGVSHIWTGTVAAQPNANVLGKINTGSNLPEAQPICLTPGNGLMLTGFVLAQDNNLQIEVIEV
ncbi:hypothetical protein [Pandoraea sp. SD6-2]|uniref:hypothetical protein n=1 Tax=Pandoraea sp. SD6-2 TaxID=1286093 RepID=UPI00032EEC36|nr:hypothetical protein [Pandoraea sp. SD6-2]EON15325.1 hypothetical protein C266_02531 [Pandoraea sp. SD6-2]